MNKLRAFFTCFSIFSFVSLAGAEEPSPAEEKGYFSKLKLPLLPELPYPAFPGPFGDIDDGYLTFYLDNDLFGGTDENYTNGGRLSWVSRDRELSSLPALQRGLAKFSGHPGDAELSYNYGFSLTQLMFTPDNIETSEFLPDQRPYGGWLGAGFSLHAKSDTVLNSLELSLGMAGPSSFAEPTQDFVHDLRSIDKAQGWDHQIGDELTANLHFTQKRKLLEKTYGPIEVDGFSHWGFDLGNLRTAGRVGAYVRAGYQLPADFASPRLGVTSYTHQVFGADRENAKKLGAFLFAGVEGRAVGYDQFLDGNLFRSGGPSVDPNIAVGEVVLGGGVRWDRVSVRYAHTYRTKEFRSQEDDQFFGSLSVSFRF